MRSYMSAHNPVGQNAYLPPQPALGAPNTVHDAADVAELLPELHLELLGRDLVSSKLHTFVSV